MLREKINELVQVQKTMQENIDTLTRLRKEGDTSRFLHSTIEEQQKSKNILDQYVISLVRESEIKLSINAEMNEDDPGNEIEFSESEPKKAETRGRKKQAHVTN